MNLWAAIDKAKTELTVTKTSGNLALAPGDKPEAATVELPKVTGPFKSGDYVCGTNENGEPISCFSCKYHDGRGVAWPGLCTIGQEAKAIDFNVVDVAHGCKCYQAKP